MKQLLMMPLFFCATLLAQSPMSPERLWNLERLGEYLYSRDEQSVYYTATSYTPDSNKGATYIGIITLKDRKNQKLFDMGGSEYNLCLIPGTQRLFFMNKGKGYHCAENGSDIQSFEGIENMENIRFSRDGSKIIFSRGVKMFPALTDKYPQYNLADARIYDDLMFRHWNAWSDENVNHIFWVSVKNMQVDGTPTDIMKGMVWDSPTMPFGGADDFIWGPDAKSIIYVCKQKNGVEYARSTNTDLFEYNLQTSATHNLSATNTGYDKSPALSADGKYLLWLSMARDGYESDQNRIFVRDMSQGINVQFTVDQNTQIEEAVWGTDGKNIYAVIPTDGTQQIAEYSFRADKLFKSSGKGPLEIRNLTEGYFNYGHLVAGKISLLAARTDMNHAAELFSVSTAKKIPPQKITTLNDKIFSDTKMAKIERRYIETTDRKKMLVWVIFPPDFDPTRKYPALLYCQGGPQSQVSQFYSFRWNFQLMASRGYIVIAPNRRGLPGFGADWNESISKDWGGQAMRDYLSATDALTKEPYVDASRIGAIGASYGGYSVYYLAGIHQKRFKTFIAHCGLFNLESWYGSTEELFFADWDVGGPYFSNPQPKSYERFSPHRLVQNWDTPIMIIHGGKDFRVPDTQGMEAFTAARVRGIKSRFLYFPNEGHWVLKPQNGLVWHNEFFKWLQETL